MKAVDERVYDSLQQVLAELLNKTEPTDNQAVSGVGALSIAAGTASSSGNTTLITPASGKSVRVYYASYNNALAVEAGFRFGAAGTIWLKNNLVANSVISKDFGDLRYVQGAVDEVLILNLSLAVSTNWTVFYVEV
ncbi:MAG: hypothetical protein A2W35_17965 [Chloroflexi bacterium RBG_16_57_11]|nr:MAG: hypothetical protein A2W35_17965 [Chloroflexi bacterium RBG_16_57_11]